MGVQVVAQGGAPGAGDGRQGVESTVPGSVFKCALLVPKRSADGLGWPAAQHGYK